MKHQTMKRKIFLWTLAGCLTAALASAQPRACLDLTADGKVTQADVELALESATAERATIDPRGDFDLKGGVTVADAVNLQRVAEGQQLGLLAFRKKAVFCEDLVFGFLQNAEIPLGASAKVVINTGKQQVEARGFVKDGQVQFKMPEIHDIDISGVDGISQAFPGADLKGLALVSIAVGDQVSNACPIRILPKGDPDQDNDGIPDSEDLCPTVPDPQNADTDFDNVGDVCDNCAADPNTNQIDSNGDGSGDACAPPDFIHVNGIVAQPDPGVDPEIEEIPAERPHGVMLLTREIDQAIEDQLADLNIEITGRLARFAFVVAGDKADLAALDGLIWFQALFPLDASFRLAEDLVNNPPQNPLVVLNVTFHDDVELADAQAILASFSASILSPGVDLDDGQGGITRSNTWQVEVQNSVMGTLADLDEVSTIQTVHPNIPGNATSRTAINVDVLNTAGLNGAGMNIAEWDQGWAAGDNMGPPFTTSHPALASPMMIRDHLMGFENINPPAGCIPFITCNGMCFTSTHATHVAGTMIGDGTLLGGGAGPNRGMADQASLTSYEWSDTVSETLCERRDAITNFSTVAHNNSWGFPAACLATMGAYHVRSAAYDLDLRLNSGTTEVFGTMNDQNFRNTGLGAGCPQPPIFDANNCTTPPPGVGPPPAVPPPVDTTNRFYTIAAPGGTAKSVLTVGNIDAPMNRLNNESGLGPMQDGRLKPEVVAHGTGVVSTCDPSSAACPGSGYSTITGSSLATPAATGALALLYEHGNNVGRPLASESSRALLAHTATDLGVHPGGSFLTVPVGGQWQPFGGTDGPDYLTGYGLIDAEAARDHVTNGNLGGTLQPSGCPTGLTFADIPFDSPVAVGGPGPVAGCPAMIWDVKWKVTIPAGLNELKVTISWNDVAATAGANPTLINDLDLMVKGPGTPWHYPWWMDPACPWRQAAKVTSPTFDNPTFSDHTNSLVQVVVDGGLTPGEWIILIRSSGLAQGPQPFSMMISAN